MIIFITELEITHDNGNLSTGRNQNTKNNHQEAKHVVDLNREREEKIELKRKEEEKEVG